MNRHIRGLDPAAVAALAYQKSIRAGQTDSAQLRDWLEAEVELQRVRRLVERLAEAKLRLSRAVAGRERTELRLTVEHAVARALARSADLASATSRILPAIAEGLGWAAGAFWGVDRPLGALCCLEFWHAPGSETFALEQESRRTALASGIGLPGRVWASQRPIWIVDVTTDTDLPRSAAARDVGLHGACGFPVRDGAEFLGVLEFFSREAREPDEELFRTMASLGSQMSQFIERRRAEESLRRRDHERDLARTIQQGFLPRTMPAPAGFAISGRMWPADTVGGDCFGFFPLAEDGLAILIADASGHGFASALLMAQVRAYIQALTLTHADVGTILALTNSCLDVNVSSEHFLTALLMRLDPRTRSLVYAGAGHLPGYLMDSRGGIRALLTSERLPLGIEPVIDYPESAPISMEPGELVLFLTDGIPEAGASAGQPFGIDRTLDVVRAHRHGAPDEIIEAMACAVRNSCGNHDQIDDMTAIVIKAE